MLQKDLELLILKKVILLCVIIDLLLIISNLEVVFIKFQLVEALDLIRLFKMESLLEKSLALKII